MIAPQRPLQSREPAGGSDLELLVPAIDAVDPEVSIVIPAVNEELCISDFVDWCHEGLQRPGSGRDPHRRQLHRPDRGTRIGRRRSGAEGAEAGSRRAYIDALPYIRGRYVIMGDCRLHL